MKNSLSPFCLGMSLLEADGPLLDGPLLSLRETPRLLKCELAALKLRKIQKIIKAWNGTTIDLNVVNI